MATVIEDEAFLGTEKKYLLEIKSAGFDMETDDFNVTIKRGANVITLKKEDLVQDHEGNFYITFDTSDLGTGVASVTVTAYVPDSDFPDGLRTEVEKFNLVRIKS
jgi:hypothetical protein